jgi:hypothetical protein
MPGCTEAERYVTDSNCRTDSREAGQEFHFTVFYKNSPTTAILNRTPYP